MSSQRTELEIVNQRIEELFQEWKNLQPMKIVDDI